jgi:S1-C subfamily serine protease
MNYKLAIISILFLLNFSVFAEEKNLKFRGINPDDNKQTISIDQEMLDIKKFNNVIDEYKVLKSSSKFVGEKFKEGPLFRGGVYSEFVQSVPLIYNEELKVIGAGAVVDKEGIILTNWHVVDKAKNLHVWFKPESGKKWQDTDSYQAEVLVVDEKKDLALIKIHGAQKLKPIPIGNSEKDIQVGDEVHAIGHPENLYWSYSKGTVSAKRENHKWAYEKSKHEANLIQIQNPISSGSSGGPLISESKKLIGINTANQGTGQNLNFAVAVEEGLALIRNPQKKTNTNANTNKAKTKKTFDKTHDSNKNGKIDTWYDDTNKNGKIDVAYLDENEDGKIDGILVDEDENGKWETLIQDTNGNGKMDIAWIDEDQDGKEDVVGYDYNEDGKWDKFKEI